MTIATNNGVPIIRDGKVVTDCGCCGGWFCYSPTAGACCNGTQCRVVQQCECNTAAGEVFFGVGTRCSNITSPPTFNHSSFVRENLCCKNQPTFSMEGWTKGYRPIGIYYFETQSVFTFRTALSVFDIRPVKVPEQDTWPDLLYAELGNSCFSEGEIPGVPAGSYLSLYLKRYNTTLYSYAAKVITQQDNTYDDCGALFWPNYDVYACSEQGFPVSVGQFELILDNTNLFPYSPFFWNISSVDHSSFTVTTPDYGTFSYAPGAVTFYMNPPNPLP